MEVQLAGLAHYGSALAGSRPTQKHKNEKEMGKTHLRLLTNPEGFSFWVFSFRLVRHKGLEPLLQPENRIERRLQPRRPLV